MKTALLNDVLKEEIFMQVLERYNAPGKICKLNKALYVLKQALLQWNRRLTEFLKTENMIQLETDQCFCKANAEKIFLAI